MRLLRLLESAPIAGLRNIQPAYTSLLLTFDQSLLDHAQLEAAVRERAERSATLSAPPSQIVEIPVCYGGEFGPDLEPVAAARSLSRERVIKLHTSRTYHAYFLGFAPGFAYLGDLPFELVMPRLSTPRKSVPAGSVAIAGAQTGIYPFATPGGWRLLGRTPLAMFRPDREPMGLIAIGDQVRFRAITREEFRALEQQ